MHITTRVRFARLCAVVVIFLILSACSKGKLRPETLEGVSPSIAPSGCSETIFPHPEGWMEVTSHGICAQRGGMAPCLQCHAVEGPTPASGVPTCSTCHLRPHPEGWRDGLVHGSEFLANTQSCLTGCHGTDGKGGFSGIACDTCHLMMRHQENFAAPFLHGGAVEQSGQQACAGCHGADFQGGISGVSCFTCHSGPYPHTQPNWEATNHGTFVVANGQQQCVNCHGSDFEGGISGVSCVGCHLGPNVHTADDWSTPVAHGPWGRGERRQACAACHGADFQGGISGVSCFGCHSGPYPHNTQANWVTTAHGLFVRENGGQPCVGCHGMDLEGGISGVSCVGCHLGEGAHTGNDWQTAARHGTFVIDNGKARCRACHGPELEGGISNVSCSTECHASYLEHTEGWRTVERHGMTALNPATRVQLCAGCHGSQWDGRGRATLSCAQSSCHNEAFPALHDEAWLSPRGSTQPHAVYALANGTTTCATARCHGVNLVPTPGVTLGANCTGCHRNLHPVGWEDGAVHGSTIVRDGSSRFDRCLNCHDATRAGAAAARSCFNCHANAPHEILPEPQRTAWSGAGHGTAALNSTVRASCLECHDGTSRAQVCTTCHINFPHPEATLWTTTSTESVRICNALLTCVDDEMGEGEGDDCAGVERCTIDIGGVPTSGIWEERTMTHISPHAQQFLNRAALNEASRCETCHGADYAGGNAGRSCGDAICHAGFDRHLSDASWATTEGGTHGASYLDGIRGAGSSCTICHLNFGVGREDHAPTCAASTGCHSYNYPHPASGWTEFRAGSHGPLLVWTSDDPQCRSCHGDNYQGEDRSPSCADGACHGFVFVSHRRDGMNHQRWRYLKNHGRAYLQARLGIYLPANASRCTGCHWAGWRASEPAAGVCNFDTTEIYEGAGRDWCSACHDMPAGGCP